MFNYSTRLITVVFLVITLLLAGCNPVTYDEDELAQVKEYAEIIIPVIDDIMSDIVELSENPTDENLITVKNKVNTVSLFEESYYKSNSFPQEDVIKEWQIDMEDEKGEQWKINGKDLNQALVDFSNGWNLFASAFETVNTIDEAEADEEWFISVVEAISILSIADDTLRKLLFNI